jgi:hypothetical protein
MQTTLLAGGGNTFIGMMTDYAKASDSRASVNACAESLGFEVKLGVA